MPNTLTKALLETTDQLALFQQPGVALLVNQEIREFNEELAKIAPNALRSPPKVELKFWYCWRAEVRVRLRAETQLSDFEFLMMAKPISFIVTRNEVSINYLETHERTLHSARGKLSIATTIEITGPVPEDYQDTLHAIGAVRWEFPKATPRTPYQVVACG